MKLRSFPVLLCLLCFTVLNISTVVAQQTITVHNKTELLTALESAKSGDTVFIPGNLEIDLTGEKTITIHTNITLASSGDRNGEGGALLFTTKNANPLFRMSHHNGHITGLRIKGPDMKIYAKGINYMAGKSAKDLKKNRLKYYKQNMYSAPLSQAIRVTANNTQIDNCEIFGWTHAGIMVQKGGEVKILNNYIHHNRRFGLGYGIDLDQGSAYIAYNLFDYNRHSIAGTGKPGTSYEIAHNTFKRHHQQAWAVDMHGGKDRKDGTDIAGTLIKIHDNTFYIDYDARRVMGIVIRGVPQKKAVIKDNTFYLYKTPITLQRKHKQLNSFVIEQKNATGNLDVKNNRVIIK